MRSACSGATPGPAVGDFQERARVRDHPAISYLDAALGVVLHGVLERVITQVPEDLPQLVRIDPHLDLGIGPTDGESGAWPLHGLAELCVEVFGPCRQRQALQARPLTRESRCTLSMMPLTRSALARMIWVKRRSSSVR